MLLDGLAVIIFNGAGLAVGLVDKPFKCVGTIKIARSDSSYYN
jgi:hypothetical protein